MRSRIDDVLDRAIRVNKELRNGLNALLDVINQLNHNERDLLAPRVEAMLEQSDSMPKAMDAVKARSKTRGKADTLR